VRLRRCIAVRGERRPDPKPQRAHPVIVLLAPLDLECRVQAVGCNTVEIVGGEIEQHAARGNHADALSLLLSEVIYPTRSLRALAAV